MSFKTVSIDSIAPNPYRNFDIYPLDKQQVADLVASYEKNDDFGVIPVRRALYEYEDGYTYEQAAGHHRLEAMRQLGYKNVKVEVHDYDDDQIVSVMVDENMRQAGNNAAGMLDSIYGITHRLTYLLLISDNVDELVEAAPSLDGLVTAKMVGHNKANLERGMPLSREMVNLMCSGFSQTRYENLSKQLRDSGMMSRLVNEVQAEVEAELEVKEAAEREEQERQRVEAERQRKAQEAAKKAAERAKAAAAKAKAEQNRLAAMEAERRQKEAEARQKKMAELRKKAAAEERDKRAKAEQYARQRAAAEKARAEAAKRAKGLNPEVLHMLASDDHLNAFRAFVVTNPSEFPRDEHPALVQMIIEVAKTHNPKRSNPVTREVITGVMNGELNKRNALRRQIMEDRKKIEEQESVVRRVDNAIADFKRDLGNVNKSLVKLAKALDDDKLGGYAFREVSTDMRLKQQLDALYSMTIELRRQLRIKGYTYAQADEGVVIVQ